MPQKLQPLMSWASGGVELQFMPIRLTYQRLTVLLMPLRNLKRNAAELLAQAYIRVNRPAACFDLGGRRPTHAKHHQRCATGRNPLPAQI